MLFNLLCLVLCSFNQVQETAASRFPELQKVLLEGACGTTLLEVTHRLVHNHPSAGHVHRV